MHLFLVGCCPAFLDQNATLLFFLLVSFPLQNFFFWICFWSILRKAPASLPEYLLKQPTKHVMFLYRLDHTRIEWGHQLFRSLGSESLASIKSTWNLPAGTVLAWGTSPPVQPHKSSQCHQSLCPQQGNEPGRGAELCCAPDLIITSYYRCFGLFWILYILFWKSLVESQPLYI